MTTFGYAKAFAAFSSRGQALGEHEASLETSWAAME
jgi:hypothetical protein